MNPEEQIKAKLIEDINELEKRRSNLTNEIKSKIDESEKLSDQEHATRMDKLEKEFETKRAELSSREKYLDDYMMRLDKQSISQKGIEKNLSDREERLSIMEKEFFTAKENAVKEINSVRAQVEKHVALIGGREEVIATREATLNAKDIRLNTREIELQNAQEKLDDTIKSIEKEKSSLLEISKENQVKLDAVIEEKNIIKSMLDDLEKQKEEISKLSVYKDDLAKIQEEQKILDKKSIEVKAFSRQVEARDVAVTEREKSAEEKAKYQMIKEREIDAKIVILKKLRETTDA
jgi:hypothetical protein